jgi:hypothetical protein
VVPDELDERRRVRFPVLGKPLEVYEHRRDARLREDRYGILSVLWDRSGRIFPVRVRSIPPSGLPWPRVSSSRSVWGCLTYPSPSVVGGCMRSGIILLRQGQRMFRLHTWAAEMQPCPPSLLQLLRHLFRPHGQHIGRRGRALGLRITSEALSRSVCKGSISRPSALATRFHDPILPAWPASEHTAAVQLHDHQGRSLLRTLWRWLRQHPTEQHLCERPDVLGEPRCHCLAEPPVVGSGTPQG